MRRGRQAACRSLRTVPAASGRTLQVGAGTGGVCPTERAVALDRRTQASLPVLVSGAPRASHLPRRRAAAAGCSGGARPGATARLAGAPTGVPLPAAAVSRLTARPGAGGSLSPAGRSCSRRASPARWAVGLPCRVHTRLRTAPAVDDGSSPRSACATLPTSAWTGRSNAPPLDRDRGAGGWKPAGGRRARTSPVSRAVGAR